MESTYQLWNLATQAERFRTSGVEIEAKNEKKRIAELQAKLQEQQAKIESLQAESKVQRSKFQRELEAQQLSTEKYKREIQSYQNIFEKQQTQIADLKKHLLENETHTTSLEKELRAVANVGIAVRMHYLLKNRSRPADIQQRNLDNRIGLMGHNACHIPNSEADIALWSLSDLGETGEEDLVRRYWLRVSDVLKDDYSPSFQTVLNSICPVMECVCRDLTHLWTTEQRNAILKLSRLFRTIDSLHKKLSREEFEVKINQIGFILHLRDMLEDVLKAWQKESNQ